MTAATTRAVTWSAGGWLTAKAIAKSLSEVRTVDENNMCNFS